MYTGIFETLELAFFLKALLENVCLLYFVGFFMTFTHLLSTCSQPM